MTVTDLRRWAYARSARQADSYLAEVADLASNLAEREVIAPKTLDELAVIAAPFEAFAVAHAEWLAVIWFGCDTGEGIAVSRYVSRLAMAAGHPHFSRQGWAAYASAPGIQFKLDKAAALRAFRRWEKTGRPGLSEGIHAAFSHLRSWAIASEARFDVSAWGVLVGALCDLKSKARSEPVLTPAQIRI